MMIRSLSQLMLLESFKERYEYLALRGVVGESTFGFDRWMNQQFYTSREWRHIRHYVIARDNGCDLGVFGRDIHDRIYIHHMNPMTVENFREGDGSILDPEFLIATTLVTHNAIHYGDERLLRQDPVVRRPGDTKLW